MESTSPNPRTSAGPARHKAKHAAIWLAIALAAYLAMGIWIHPVLSYAAVLTTAAGFAIWSGWRAKAWPRFFLFLGAFVLLAACWPLIAYLDWTFGIRTFEVH